MSSCQDNNKFFLEESVHFVNTFGPVLNEMETMQKNDIVVYFFHSINYILKIMVFISLTLAL
jgi:uncharacterized membrane protein YqhA